MERSITLIVVTLIICWAVCYSCHRICSTIDHGNTSALGFRALELGYNGEIDVQELMDRAKED